MSEAQHLVDWFRASARPLPWRTVPRDPYRSLVSELMAQQTQIDRVVPRFEEFVRRFPSLAELAAATEEQVLEAWSGLGYYRRARSLHRLAREVVSGSGELPGTSAKLEELPGIGPYTAAAIASMVNGEAVPLMDGNVARVGARFMALIVDPRKPDGRAAILEWGRGLMEHHPPGEVNEGLMELGATVCLPVNPECGHCPLKGGCQAFVQGDPEAFPPPRKTRAAIDLRWLAVIVESADGRWLLHQVNEGPILRGLWLPPFSEFELKRRLSEQVTRLLPFEVETPAETLDSIKHSITHRRIEVTPVRVLAVGPDRLPDGWRWVRPASPGVPTSSLLGKLARSIAP